MHNIVKNVTENKNICSDSNEGSYSPVLFTDQQ